MGLHRASHGLHVEAAGGLATEDDQGPAEVDGFQEQFGVGRRSPDDAGISEDVYALQENIESESLHILSSRSRRGITS